MVIRIASDSCYILYDYLREVGFVPEITDENCLIFDEGSFHGKELPIASKGKVFTSKGGLNEICSVSSYILLLVLI